MHPHCRVVRAANRHTCTERLQAQRCQVDRSFEFRVSRVQHLEAPVAAEAVDDIGADPTADVVGGLPYPDIAALFGEHRRTAQSGQPGTDHHNLGVDCSHCSDDLRVRPRPRVAGSGVIKT